MKLLTTIPPRADGTVIAEAPRAKGVRTPIKYVFTEDGNGILSCDVPDDAAVTAFLASGNFEPYNEDDFQAAEDLLQASLTPRERFRKSVEQARSASLGDGEEDGEDDDLQFPDYDGAAGAEAGGGPMPIEANTPPKANKRKAAASADA